MNVNLFKRYLIGFVLCPLLAVFGSAAAFAEEPDAPSMMRPIDDMYFDVDESAWYFEALDYCWNQHIFVFNDSDYFNPNENMTRGNVIISLGLAAEHSEALNVDMDSYKSCSFTDVLDLDLDDTNEQNTEKYFAWAETEKIAAGYGDGTFGINDPLTREQMAVILNNYMEYLGIGFNAEKSFIDDESISSWAKNAVSKLSGANVIAGFPDGSFEPKKALTKAESAQLLFNFINSI